VRWWLLVCLVTGPTEEISWRAVLPALGARLGLAPLAAVGLSALLFALAHMVQGRLAAAIVLLIAALFHGLVALSGSLVTAIAVHALYDAIVTVWLAPRLHRAVDGPAG
jgi:membrane protease YdiL (CAAX protease family)